jgi:hypothetical protein
MSFNERTYVALVHHPVLEKGGRVVTTAVTNLDVHDIARASRTFGLAGYFVVTPITAQQRLVEEIRGHWVSGAGREHNDKRTDALELVQIVASIDAAREAIAARHGVPPCVVATGARARAGSTGYRSLRAARDADPRATLLLFGTGWGLADEAFQTAEAVLDPIHAPPQGRPHAGAEYNHLSVRSAVAIVLDRLFGSYE